MEEDILNKSRHSSEDALRLYEQEGKELHKRTIYHLSVLNRLQSSVGGELLKDSKSIAASSELLTTLQIVLAVITGIIILMILFSFKIMNRTQENFHLN